MQRQESIPERGPRWRAAFGRWLALLVLLSPGVVWFPAEASPPDPWDSAAGTLWLRSSSDADPAPALGVATTIRARVTANVARVEVVQEFSNPLDEWVEGLYVFPLAAEAAVDGLELQLADRTIRGEIQPRAVARERYETARRDGRRASLVDQQRPNLFSTAVANIAPRSAVTVRITYLETVPWRDERYTLRLPLAVTPRYSPAGVAPTPERVSAAATQARIEVELRPGFALESARSLHHPVTISAVPGRVTVLAEAASMDREFELEWRPVLKPDTQAAVFTEQFEGQWHALVMLTPPRLAQASTPAREVIFVIDTSGSMGGSPMQQARAALQLGVSRLGPRDRFNIVRFSSDASALFPAPVPADRAAREIARRFVDSLRASGGTEMRPALELALPYPDAPAGEWLRQVVFITDGSVANEAEIVALIRRRLGDARLFTVGIGAAPNAWFMHEAAAAGRGSYTFIPAIETVEARMADLFLKLERPALVGLALHWPGGGAPELAAPLPRDLYAGDPLVLAVRGRGAPPQGLLTVSGQGAAGAWVQQLPLVPTAGEAGIARLWARERIAELSRHRRLAAGESTAALEAEMLELSLRYGLVSELASLVAVDEEPARPAHLPDRPLQAATSAPAGGAWARSTGFAATATPAPLLLRFGLLALLAAIFLFGQAGWIHFKAAAAQVLVDRAFDRARLGEERPAPWPWADTWPVARLYLPGSDRPLVVLAGASGRNLAFGPAHDSASPSPGAPGNSVIAGHRDTHFRALEGLAHGDVIRLERVDGRHLEFRVTGTEVVDSRRWRLGLEGETPRLTLVTCHPFGAADAGGPLRFVVTAEPVPAGPTAVGLLPSG